MITNIMPLIQPVLSVQGQATSVSSGDGDDLVESGETAQLTLTLLNSGWDAENVSGMLHTADPYIVVESATAGFGNNIAADQTASNAVPYQITIDPECPNPHVAVFALAISASGGYARTDSLMLFIGNATGFYDDMEGVCDLWRSSSPTPGWTNQWHLETYRSHGGDVAWKMGGNGSAYYANSTDAALVTPPFLLGPGSTLRFWHWIDAEEYDGSSAYDGGVVMLGTGDGNWTQITPLGGYPHTFFTTGTPLTAGTPCYSGYQNWQQEEFDLSTYSGVVRLMFRFVSDPGVRAEGWYIDDIEVQGTGCCVGDRGNIDGGENENIDISDLVFFVNYMFKQGPAPTCFEEADVDATGEHDISDLVYVVNHMFKQGPGPLDCLQ